MEDFAEIKTVLAARAAFYRTLASLFFDTLTQEQIDAMAAQDFSAYADVNEDFASGVNDITRYLAKRNSGTRDELAADFTGTFIGTKAYKDRVAVPYESVFTSEGGLLYQESYQKVYRIFKSQAVRLAPGLDWPSDHLSFLCQFMALLSDRAAEALQAGDTAKALEQLQLSSDFLDQHILSWYDALRAQALLVVETRFYRGVLSMAHGFFALDRETLDDLLAQIGK